MTSAIDLSKLPKPEVIHVLSYEDIYEQWKSALSAIAPEHAAVLELESEPLVKLMQVGAYRELVLRQRINDASYANMLAFSEGSDLDNLGALYKVSRLVVQEADNTIYPPIAEILEADDRLRYRIQLAMEGFSSAGPDGAYLFYSLSASAGVKSVSVQGPPDIPDGEVKITVLSTAGDGTAYQDLLDIVSTSLNEDDVRPLTDKLTVQTATIETYSVTAELHFFTGPDSSLVMDLAQSALEKYVTDNHKVGADITLSGIYAALHQQGVSRVDLTAPTTNLITNKNTARYCDTTTGITLTNGGISE